MCIRFSRPCTAIARKPNDGKQIGALVDCASAKGDELQVLTRYIWYGELCRIVSSTIMCITDNYTFAEFVMIINALFAFEGPNHNLFSICNSK